jgi:hypothetical protein
MANAPDVIWPVDVVLYPVRVADNDVQLCSVARPQTIRRESVLQSAGGTWVDGNLTNDVVLAGVAWGNSNTGTFDEAARNTDPGVAYTVVNTAYRIRGVDKVGTHRETTRRKRYTNPSMAPLCRQGTN